jgi:hypothetical protein
MISSNVQPLLYTRFVDSYSGFQSYLSFLDIFLSVLGHPVSGPHITNAVDKMNSLGTLQAVMNTGRSQTGRFY